MKLQKRAQWRRVATALSAAILGAGLLPAQDRPATNPRDGDQKAIREGLEIFRTHGCADCHGLDAKGVRGPDLTSLWESGVRVDRLFQTIRRGVPGSEMPPNNGPDEDIWAVLAYLHTLNAPVAAEASTGSADDGARVFSAKCGSCHRVNGYGGDLGPDLSHIGGRRSRTALMRKIRNASAYIIVSAPSSAGMPINAPPPSGYAPVTLVTRDGQRIRGTKKNEDAFSIQIMDTRGRLQGYLKSDLRETIDEKVSLMPDFTPALLSEHDLNDLLKYLGTLRGPTGNTP
jgi:mono/diheme cytochrome c family protein